MRQYWEQKQQVPDAILLFRMGDFYELFYDDAELAARVLGLTLTSRDRGKTPLAGMPAPRARNVPRPTRCRGLQGRDQRADRRPQASEGCCRSGRGAQQLGIGMRTQESPGLVVVARVYPNTARPWPATRRGSRARRRWPPESSWSRPTPALRRYLVDSTAEPGPRVARRPRRRAD